LLDRNKQTKSKRILQWIKMSIWLAKLKVQIRFNRLILSPLYICGLLNHEFCLKLTRKSRLDICLNVRAFLTHM